MMHHRVRGVISDTLASSDLAVCSRELTVDPIGWWNNQIGNLDLYGGPDHIVALAWKCMMSWRWGAAHFREWDCGVNNMNNNEVSSIG